MYVCCTCMYVCNECMFVVMYVLFHHSVPALNHVHNLVQIQYVGMVCMYVCHV